MSTKSIRVRTATDGSFTYERDFSGLIRAVEFQVGDLSTPDIAITDGIYGTAVYSGTGVAADDIDPAVNVVVMGTLKVVIAGAGDTKAGWIYLLVET